MSKTLGQQALLHAATLIEAPERFCREAHYRTDPPPEAAAKPVVRRCAYQAIVDACFAIAEGDAAAAAERDALKLLHTHMGWGAGPTRGYIIRWVDDEAVPHPDILNAMRTAAFAA